MRGKTLGQPDNRLISSKFAFGQSIGLRDEDYSLVIEG